MDAVREVPVVCDRQLQQLSVQSDGTLVKLVVHDAIDHTHVDSELTIEQAKVLYNRMGRAIKRATKRRAYAGH